MKTSITITKIAPALLLAQKEIGSATKDAVNPFFKSKYADLGSVMEACKDPLNKNGIIILQPVGNSEQGTTVETILLHESGEFISDVMDVSVKQCNDPQAQGSAITYARRYSLQSMLFIPADDDDGEKGTDHKENATQSTTGGNSGTPYPATDKQKNFATKLWLEAHPGEMMPDETKQIIETISSKQISELIEKWKNPDQLPIKPKEDQGFIESLEDEQAKQLGEDIDQMEL